MGVAATNHTLFMTLPLNYSSMDVAHRAPLLKFLEITTTGCDLPALWKPESIDCVTTKARQENDFYMKNLCVNMEDI